MRNLIDLVEKMSGGKNVTIADATTKKGIDRKKADRILDPHDYFGKNKRKNHIREYLAMVEAQNVPEACDDCFRVVSETAWDLMSKYPHQRDQIRIVHARVNGQASLSGYRYGHAWAELGDTVFDRSNNRNLVLPKRYYYELGKVRNAPGEYASYDVKTYNQKLVETENYGPWDLLPDSPPEDMVPNTK